MRIGLIAVVVALALTACSEAPQHQASDGGFAKAAANTEGATRAQASPTEFAAAEGGEAAPADVAATSAPDSGKSGVPVAGAMLAYVYDSRLWLPKEAVAGIMANHQATCIAAGPAVCQVIGAQSSQRIEDEVTGALELRATPQFAQDFVASLQGDAAKLKGRIEQSRTSEDLTRAIIDTEAALRAKTTLRDRLQALLRDRPGRLSDLLETEQALANVQQEIDSAQSYLIQMRQRVATSRVSIDYFTLRGPVNQADFDVLGNAITSFFGNMAWALASIITTISFLLPWLLVGAPLIYGGYKGIQWLLSRRRNAAKSPAVTNPNPD